MTLLSRGRTAEIYSIGEDRILKLFLRDFPYNSVENEFRNTVHINQAGIAAPKAFEKVFREGRHGIIFERIWGVSLLSEIFNEPRRIDEFSVLMAQQHSKIHARDGKGLPSFVDSLYSEISRAELLSSSRKSELLDRLSKLETSESVCHGDFHPDNIILTVKGIVVIDWMTASCGNPATDVARTSIILSHSRPVDEELLERIPNALEIRDRFHSVYLDHYIRLSGISKTEIDYWKPIVAAARLNENLPTLEKQALLEIANNSN
jgi:uncharacterized protein (TIGR02172 family)